jgi:hypothetical protein
MIKSYQIVHILLHVAVCSCFITRPHYNNQLCTYNNQLCKHKMNLFKHKMNLFNRNITITPTMPNTLNILDSKIIKDLPGVIIFYVIYSYIL